ncbi:MAG TPA: hypothetical protein VHV55_18350 [Pirellulales bacterium]|jgi:Amt family ammonium transporter|nr:hypothetical protein [Pirellulales bacterium]
MPAPYLLVMLACLAGDDATTGQPVGPAPAAEGRVLAPPDYFNDANTTAWPDAPSGDSKKVYEAVARATSDTIWPASRSWENILSWSVGITLVVGGLSRTKRGLHNSMMCLAIFPLACVSFWAYGFAFGWGNWFNGPVPPGWYSPLGPGLEILNHGVGLGANPAAVGEFKYGLLGTTGFFPHAFDNAALLSLFWLMLVSFETAATIPIWSMAECWSWRNFCCYGLWVALPFALIANWTWGGGWLAQAGGNWGLGHGFVDFAGSGVVYGLGGMIALAGRRVVGPSGRHLRKVSRRGIPLLTAGLAILLVPLLFLEIAGPAILNAKTAIISAGSLVLLWPLARRRTPSPVMVGCGALSGLVAISGACAYVSFAAAVIIGGVAGIVFMSSVSLLERKSIGVEAGAISVFGASGIWGLLAVGCFANGTGGHGFNGVVRDAYVAKYGNDGVRGLFYGDPSQLVVQLLGAAVVAIVGFGLAFAFFKVSNWFVPVRVAAVVEPAVPRAADASGQQPL